MTYDTGDQPGYLRWLVVTSVTPWLPRGLLMLEAGIEPNVLHKQHLAYRRYRYFRDDSEKTGVPSTNGPKVRRAMNQPRPPGWYPNPSSWKGAPRLPVLGRPRVAPTYPPPGPQAPKKNTALLVIGLIAAIGVVTAGIAVAVVIVINDRTSRLPGTGPPPSSVPDLPPPSSFTEQPWLSTVPSLPEVPPVPSIPQIPGPSR